MYSHGGSFAAERLDQPLAIVRPPRRQTRQPDRCWPACCGQEEIPAHAAQGGTRSLKAAAPLLLWICYQPQPSFRMALMQQQQLAEGTVSLVIDPLATRPAAFHAFPYQPLPAARIPCHEHRPPFLRAAVPVPATGWNHGVIIRQSDAPFEKIAGGEFFRFAAAAEASLWCRRTVAVDPVRG